MKFIPGIVYLLTDGKRTAKARQCREWLQAAFGKTVEDVLHEPDAHEIYTRVAAKIGKDRPYVSKCLRLATVSPRIIRAVLRGRAPDQISIEKLVSLESEDWEEQERAVGLL